MPINGANAIFKFGCISQSWSLAILEYTKNSSSRSVDPNVDTLQTTSNWRALACSK